MEYTILGDSDMHKLVAIVNERLREGWRPQGGLIVLSGLGDNYEPVQHYLQPVVRPANENHAQESSA